MKRLARLCVLACTLAPATPALAEKIDLSTSTCKQFLESGDDNIRMTLAWLSGYYREEDDPPVIDTEKLVNDAKKLGAFCGKNPDLGLITASDKVFK